jgi:hypothetical protein
MGSWGFRALECDEGLDIIEFLKVYIPGHENLFLGQIVAAMQKEMFFAENPEEVDFYSDNSVIALTEMFFQYHDDEVSKCERDGLFKGVKSFTGDIASLKFLYAHLSELRNQLTDKHTRREIIQTWRDSKQWNKHLSTLLERLEALINV